MKITDTTWIKEKGLIVTTLSGEVDSENVEHWKTSLHRTLAGLDDNATFKIVVNLHGFKAVNIDAHKRFRGIVPETLANYGWKVGYVNLFEEASDLKLTNIRGIRCVAAAHVHHDNTKIERYEENFGREDEHFFVDPAQAFNWISSLL